jgi:uncharacterized protein (UPF0332 family)
MPEKLDYLTSTAMDLREEDDYNLKSSNESAGSIIEGAQAFLDAVKGVLNYRP